MGDYEFTISLRIRHPTMDPHRITESLALMPQHTWKAGDPRREPGGDEIDGVFHESLWMGRLMEQPQLSSRQACVESVLHEVLLHLRRAQFFLERLHSEGGTTEIQVSLFPRADFRLEWPSELIAGFSRIRAALVLDVHPQAMHAVGAEQAG